MAQDVRPQQPATVGERSESGRCISAEAGHSVRAAGVDGSASQKNMERGKGRKREENGGKGRKREEFIVKPFLISSVWEVVKCET